MSLPIILLTITLVLVHFASIVRKKFLDFTRGNMRDKQHLFDFTSYNSKSSMHLP